MNHPTRHRLENIAGDRLKRQSFVHQSKTKLAREHLQDLPKKTLTLIPASLPTRWQADHLGQPVVNTTVKYVGSRDTQSDSSKRALTLAMIAGLDSCLL